MNRNVSPRLPNPHVPAVPGTYAYRRWCKRRDESLNPLYAVKSYHVTELQHQQPFAQSGTPFPFPPAAAAVTPGLGKRDLPEPKCSCSRKQNPMHTLHDETKFLKSTSQSGKSSPGTAVDHQHQTMSQAHQQQQQQQQKPRQRQLHEVKPLPSSLKHQQQNDAANESFVANNSSNNSGKPVSKIPVIASKHQQRSVSPSIKDQQHEHQQQYQEQHHHQHHPHHDNVQNPDLPVMSSNNPKIVKFNLNPSYSSSDQHQTDEEKRYAFSGRAGESAGHQQHSQHSSPARHRQHEQHYRHERNMVRTRSIDEIASQVSHDYSIDLLELCAFYCL